VYTLREVTGLAARPPVRYVLPQIQISSGSCGRSCSTRLCAADVGGDDAAVLPRETVRGLERPAGYALCKATKTERKEIFATNHDMYHHDAGTYPADT
jgi:hypothetical protein